MSVIGQIQKRASRNGDILEGHISTLQISLRFRLVPTPKTSNLNAPDYRIVSRNGAGAEIDIGVAWIKIMKKEGREGEEFLTLTFDDPCFPKTLNVAAFLNSDTGNWDVTFRRRQERAA